MTDAALRIWRLAQQAPPSWVREKGPVREGDVALLIAEPSLIVDQQTGQLVLAYLPVEKEEQTAAVVRALQLLPFAEHTRTGGLVTRSRTFGFHPRNGIRWAGCGAAALARERPATHALLTDYAQRVARAYAATYPALYARHERLARGVRDEWHLAGTPFTGGIVNCDNPLAYHRDRGNFARVWSAMVAFRRDVAGGRLIVPAYNLGLEIADHTLTLFDGQALLHGVSPLIRTSGRAYRYTIVYYSQALMSQCLPLADEQARSQRRRPRV